MSQYSDIKHMMLEQEQATRKYTSKSYLDNYAPISTVKIRELSRRKSSDLDAMANMGYNIAHENGRFRIVPSSRLNLVQQQRIKHIDRIMVNKKNQLLKKSSVPVEDYHYGPQWEKRPRKLRSKSR